MKIAVFDMDDTVIDSHLRYEHGILVPLDKAGIAYDPATIIATINPLGYPGTVEYFTSLGVPGTMEEIGAAMFAGLAGFYGNEVTAAPGAKAYLQQLKAEGVRCFLLTASPHVLIDLCMPRLGLAALFEAMWSTDDFGLVKTQPELYRTIADKLGCAPEEITFYDDGVAAIRTARSAGWHTCGVCPPHAIENAGIADVAHECIGRFEELL